MFSCEFCEIFKNTVFTEHLQWLLLYLNILAAANLDDKKQELPEHKLVNVKNRTDLLKVTGEVFQSFRITKQMFKNTQKCVPPKLMVNSSLKSKKEHKIKEQY